MLLGGEVQGTEGCRFQEAIAVLVGDERDVALGKIGEVTVDGALGDREALGELGDGVGAAT